MNELNIFYEDKDVGIIVYDAPKNEFNFKYNKQWMETGFELSPSLKFNQTISPTEIKNFIENLLPEGNGLEILSQYYHISKQNKFSLLSIIGAETTGALTFSLKHQVKTTSFKKISKELLYTRIEQRKEKPLAIWDGKPRLSIAGVQEKLPILLIDGIYGFGEGDLASTHILKFNTNDENLVLNEHLSLVLAKSSGLNVAHSEIINISKEEVLQVKRFDRVLLKNKHVKRIHIIDSNQALNLPVSFKYERNFGSGRDVKDIREGVSYKKLFDLAHVCISPIIVKKELIKWICVNLCLGNSDAHGKNISFIIDKKGIKLAPFYDIVNITLYEAYDHEMAMGIDDEFSFKELSGYDFYEFCKKMNIDKKMFTKEFINISTKILDKLNNIDDLKTNKSREDFCNKYKINVQNRIEQLLFVIEYMKEIEE